MTDDRTIPELLRQFYADLPSYAWVRPEQVDASVNDAYMDVAVRQKRAGNYVDSVTTYIALAERLGVVYVRLLWSMYKPVVTAGYLGEGAVLLAESEKLYQTDPVKPMDGLDLGEPITSSFEWQWTELAQAVTSPASLYEYLEPLSGNPGYRFPRGYAVMVEEYRAMSQRGLQGTSAARHPGSRRDAASSSRSATSKPATNAKSSSAGCYIATAVYGSYEAPEVLTLRRFRDQKLASTAAGRTAIRTYYAVSPSLARRLATASALNRAARRLLNVVVRRVARLPLTDDIPD